MVKGLFTICPFYNHTKCTLFAKFLLASGKHMEENVSMLGGYLHEVGTTEEYLLSGITKSLVAPNYNQICIMSSSIRIFVEA